MIYFNNDALRSARHARQYTQEEVAEAIGVSYRTYQNWEQGVASPSATHFLRLMVLLKVYDPFAFAYGVK